MFFRRNDAKPKKKFPTMSRDDAKQHRKPRRGRAAMQSRFGNFDEAVQRCKAVSEIPTKQNSVAKRFRALRRGCAAVQGYLI